MSNDNTMYQVREIDRTIWRTFRAKCIMNGFNSANECLLKLIAMYAKDKIDVKK